MLGGNVCRSHGGAAKQVREKAQRRLAQAADVLVQRLLSFALDGNVDDPVALRAIQDALDRAGLSPKTAVEIEIKPFERIFEKMEETTSRAEYRRSQGIEDFSDQRSLPPGHENIEDAEVTEDYLLPIPPEDRDSALCVDPGAIVGRSGTPATAPAQNMSFEAAVSAAAAMNRQRALPRGR